MEGKGFLLVRALCPIRHEADDRNVSRISFGWRSVFYLAITGFDVTEIRCPIECDITATSFTSWRIITSEEPGDLLTQAFVLLTSNDFDIGGLSGSDGLNGRFNMQLRQAWFRDSRKIQFSKRIVAKMFD